MPPRIGSAKGQPLREVRMNGTELSGRATAIFTLPHEEPTREQLPAQRLFHER